MLIERLKLVNFKGIYSGMGIKEIELDFKDNPYRKIMIMGENGRGKSVIQSALTPFNENFDKRKNIIIEGTEGLKEIDIRNGEYLYEIRHFYAPKKNKSFIVKVDKNGNREDLNPAGNVGSFLKVVEQELGITKDIMKLVKLSDKALSFIDFIASERKEFLGQFVPSVDEYLVAYKNTNDKLNSLSKDIKYIGNELDRLDSREDCEKNLNLIEGNIARLNKQLKAANITIAKLEADLSSMSESEEQITELTKEKVRYTKELKILKDSLEELDENAKNAFSKRDFDLTQITDLLNTVTTNLLSYDKEQNSFFKNLSKLESNCQSLSDNIKTLQSQKKKILNQVDSTEESDSLRSTLEEYKSNLSNDEDIIEYANSTTIQEIQESIDEYRLAIGFLENNLANQRNNKPSLSIESLSIDDIFKDLPRKKFNRIAMISLVEKNISQLESLKDNLDKVHEVCGNDLLDAQDENMEYRHIVKHLDKCTCKGECGLVEFIKDNVNQTSKQEKVNKLRKKLREITERLSLVIADIKELKNLISFIETVDLMNNDKGYEIYKRNSENNSNALELVFNMVSKDINASVKEFKEAIDFLQKTFNHKVSESNIASIENKLNQFSQVESSIREIDKLIKISQDSLEKEEPLCNEARINYEELTKKIRLVSRSKELIEKCIKILNDIQNKENLLVPIEKELDKLKKKINTILDIKESIKDANDGLETIQANIENETDNSNALKVKIKRIEEFEERLQTILSNRDKLALIKDALDVRTGIPLVLVGSYLEPIKKKTNDFLYIAHKGRFFIDFELTDKEFNIPIYKNGILNSDDVAECSGGESSLIKISLSMGIISRIFELTDNRFNIIYLDELDGVLDPRSRPLFLNMLDKQLSILGSEQCFIISHNDSFDSEEIGLIILDDSIDHKLEDETFMNNKHVIFKLTE
jgi:DNA repair exonuclease SbcCD ATPase subunit